MIKRVSDSDFDIYNDFLKKHKNSHFMQSRQWASFKSGQENYSLISLADDGSVRGVMSMFVQIVPRTGAKYLYCPRGPICDRDDTEVLNELLDGAAEIAEEISAYKLTLDPDITEESGVWLSALKRRGAHIGDNAEDNGILQPFSVFRIDIDGKSDEELIASFHSKARYSVRSSIKSGATCRIGTREDIPVFCRLLADTAKRDGFTARGEKYFEEMFDALSPDMVKIFIVEYEGHAIAGSVLVRCGNKSWHLYGGSSEEHKEVLPNFLMQWEMMRWSIANGCAIYDMRGIAGEGDKLTPLEGLVRFKKRFGGELVTFVGRIDIVYNRRTDKTIKLMKRLLKTARSIVGRK